MIGAGTVINPIIKVVTTVAVLAAACFFIVRPVLDTAEKAVNSAGDQFNRSQQHAQQALHDSNLQAAHSRANSYRDSLQSGWPAAAREVGSCIPPSGSSTPCRAIAAPRSPTPTASTPKATPPPRCACAVASSRPASRWRRCSAAGTLPTTSCSADDQFKVPNRIQNQVDRALDQTNGVDADRLQSCIRRAIDDGAGARRIERCTDRFGR